MAENTNDLESDDAALDNKEFETSGMTEETIGTQITYPPMDSAKFEEILTDFFTKHKKSKLRLVSQIAFEFKGQENAVMQHLNNKYVLGITNAKPKKKADHNSAEHNSTEHVEHTKNIGSSEVEKPKSKKKLFIVIIIVVVLAGLGVAGFMMKDKLMAMTGKNAETEQVKAKVESTPKTIQPKKVIAPVNDSTKTTPTDSTKTIVTDSAKTN